MTGTRFNARVIRAPRGNDPQRQVLADRSAAAHADEQPRPRGRREARRAGRLWRHRPGRAQLGVLRPHRRSAEDARTTTRRCWSSPASRSACSAPTRMRRACCIANSNLVPHWATWEHFHELDRKGLMMYGQMTAGSWIYIGTPGHRAGHLRDLRRGGPPALRRRPRGPLDPDRRASAAWAARSRSRRRWPAPRCSRSNAEPERIEKRLETRYLDAKTATLDEALAILERAKQRGKAISVGLLGNAAEIFPEILKRGIRPDMVTDQTSRARSAQRLPARRLDARAAAEMRAARSAGGA